MFIAIPFINGIVDFICQHFVTLAECAGSGEGSAPNLQREQPQVGAGNPQPVTPHKGSNLRLQWILLVSGGMFTVSWGYSCLELVVASRLIYMPRPGKGCKEMQHRPNNSWP